MYLAGTRTRMSVLVVALGCLLSPALSRAAWQSPAPISSETASGLPVVASSGNGERFFLWSDAMDSSGAFGTYAAVQATDGNVSQPMFLSPNGFGPQVTADSRGRAYAAWEYEPPEGSYCVRQ